MLQIINPQEAVLVLWSLRPGRRGWNAAIFHSSFETKAKSTNMCQLGHKQTLILEKV